MEFKAVLKKLIGVQVISLEVLYSWLMFGCLKTGHSVYI